MPAIEAIAHEWKDGAQMTRVPEDEAAVFVGGAVTVLCPMVGAAETGGIEVIVIWLMVGAAEASEAGADKLGPAGLPLVAGGRVLATEDS